MESPALEGWSGENVTFVLLHGHSEHAETVSRICQIGRDRLVRCMNKRKADSCAGNSGSIEVGGAR